MASMISVSDQAADSALATLAFSRQEMASAARSAHDGQGSRSFEPFMPAGVDLPADTAAVAVVSPALLPDFRHALGALAIEMARAPATAIVLVPWKRPPDYGSRPDGIVDSFLCDATTFRSLCAHLPSRPSAHLCFALLDGILNERLAVDRVVVRQLPAPREPSSSKTERAGLIMAHRGKPEHLSAALRSIARADGAESIVVRVGLDLDDVSAYRAVRARCPDATFFHVDPSPAGLFVVRQHLLERGDEELFWLQDSDDVSCADRFTAQVGELRRTACDLVGCHELRVNEMTGTVEAFRLPLDVQDALGRGYSESLLNGTVVGRRRAVLDIGGYSTDQRIANDTQFMLRAYFSLRMRNVDGFYYLRRSHKASLTIAPETGFGTPLRTRLRDTWASDFEAVRAGRLPIERSSLRPSRTAVAYRIREWM